MKQLLAMLLAFVTLLTSPTALGYVPEVSIDTAEKLPQSIAEALPAEMSFAKAEGDPDTLMVLMEKVDGARQAFFFGRNEKSEAYALESQSAILPVINGEAASVGFDGYVYIHLGSGDRSWNGTFEQDDQGNWMLASLNDGGILTSYWANYLEMVTVIDEYTNTDSYVNIERYVYGEYLFDRNLSHFDISQMPTSSKEATEMMNTDGYAMVKSDTREMRSHLRAAPSQDAISYGEYYSGTPVKVDSVDGEWAKVSVGDAKGYMLCEGLAFGEEMKTVTTRFPSDHDMGSVVMDLTEDILLYAQPSTSAEVVGIYGGRITRLTGHFVGDIDDEWFHMICDNGLSCYIQKKYFWNGNG
ncbi:MAG: SH3 domain-containing protein [Clostridiales bacterium]|nr:SH3 domain-containing protein [Clostridiales bacterium]